MYRSCLVCRSDLGENSAVEHFPISDELAFSPEEGRLWAICGHCGEWNLVPLEKRWEAVEECESIYLGALERGWGDGLGVARLPGLTLIRVGHRSDLPTLRYTSRLRQRERSYRWRKFGLEVGDYLLTSVLVVGSGALFGAAAAFIAGVGTFLTIAVYREVHGQVVAEVEGEDGETIEVSKRDLRDARLVPEEGEAGDERWALRIRRRVELRGDVAIEALRVLLPLLNRSSEPEALLERALRYIDEKGGTLHSVFNAAARRRGRRRTARVAKLDPYIRLALEMLASAETEERAISFDLAPLRSAWRRAETLARIQDDLAFELGVVEKITGADGS